MKQNKLPARILDMLDVRKRRAMMVKLVVLSLGLFAILVWANQWESPLAVIPRVFSGVMLGYLVLCLQSVRLYPRLEHYFDLDALRRDAQQGPPPLPDRRGGPSEGDN